MSDKPISDLRRRLIADMTVRTFSDKTRHDHIRHIEAFARFLGRSPDTTTGDDIRRFQLAQVEQSAQPPKMNAQASALRFFFTITLGRADLAHQLARTHYPRKLPRVLAADQVARLIEAAPGPGLAVADFTDWSARRLHVLLTVVQSSSMAKAAQHLAVSQPAVSKAIADLEHTLGVRLLDRGPRGVEPTLYGSALVKRGLTIFDELRQGVGEIEFMADPTVGEVRMGCSEAIVATLLPQVIERFSSEHPGVVLHVAQMNPVTHEIRELSKRNVDLMVGRMAVPFEEDDVNAEILFEEPLIIVAGAQSQWTRRRKIEMTDLIDEKWILYPAHQTVSLAIERAFHAQGLDPPRAKVLTFSMQLHHLLLMAGDYLSVLPLSIVQAFNAKRLTVKPLINLSAQARPVAMFTLKNRTLSPVVEQFMECVRTVSKSMVSR